MTYQKILKNSSLEKMMGKLAEVSSSARLYEGEMNFFTENDCIENRDIQKNEHVTLLMPDKNNHHDFENAKLIFEYYKNLTPVQASDARLWVYLAHFDFWEYMKLRFPLPNRDSRSRYILEHWYLNGVNPNTLIRHGVARLWWGAYMTYDSTKNNPYELTEELFSMLDYTRTLITGTQGRNKEFTHALLEFVKENPQLFKSNKEARVRFIMRKMNYAGGYKIFSGLTKKEIKGLFAQEESEIKKITD